MIGFLVQGRVRIKIKIRLGLGLGLGLCLTLAFTIGAIVAGANGHSLLIINTFHIFVLFRFVSRDISRI